MKKIVLTAFCLAQTCLAPYAFADNAIRPLSLSIKGIRSEKPIPDRFAYCMPDGQGRSKDGGNISPAISWSGAPEATQSYALIVVDRDVPASFERANQPGKTIPKDFGRQDFYHWVLVNIPAQVHGLLEGKNSNGIAQGGKSVGKTDYGINGQNDYALMSSGPHGGYDGPCPPWNDERLHRYHFMVYALDVPSLALPNPIKGKQAEAAMAGHILAKGEVVGTYSNNPVWLSPSHDGVRAH